MVSGVREIESLRRELEVSTMERAQLQTRVDELLEKASEAERLRAELERLKVSSPFFSYRYQMEPMNFIYCIIDCSESTGG